MTTVRRIVITGAGRGLGRALTEKFIELGHTVIGCGRNPELLRQLSDRYGRPHRFDAVDVTSDSQTGEWAKLVLADGGPPDLLLNNAAIINRNAPLWQVPPEEFSQVVDVNIKGVFHLIRHFAPAMIARKQGVIVNFSSGWGRSTSPEVAPYCATKFAVEGLTQALAAELPAGMAAVPLNPGVIHTDMLHSCLGDNANSFPTPVEWAESAAPFILQLSAKDNGRSLSVKE